MSTLTAKTANPKLKRRLIGVVISDRMNKTRVVSVSRTHRHPKYGKYIRSTHSFKAHDANNAYPVGSEVIIEETRPLSRAKRWRIIGRTAKSENQPPVGENL